MLLDKQNLMIDGVSVQNIPAAATTTADSISTTTPVAGGYVASIDLATASRRRGPGLKVFAMIHGAAVAGGTSLVVNINTGAAAATKTTLVATSGVIVTATMVAGYEFWLSIPQDIKLLRFLCADVVQAGTAFTGAGLLTVGLVPDGDTQTAQV